MTPAPLSSVELWRSEAFRDRVADWVAARLGAVGLEVTGDGDQPHARPWSSALRFPTSGGPVWFKVNGPGTRHEPALMRLLASRVPDLLPEVLAVEVDLGWSLCRDAGPALREVLAAQDSWSAWEGVLARYAEAQLQLADSRAAVLGAGVREVSPATVPALAATLVDELAAVPTEDGGLRREDVDRLGDVLPPLGEWCAELAGSGVPDSLQHDDLHSRNVCWNGSVATARIIDWGDATWGCPLSTMLGTMRSLAFHAGTYVEGQPVTDPRVLRARDAYLEPFTARVPQTELRRLVGLASRTGCVGKATAWRAALAGTPREVRAELGFPVRDWVLGLLEQPTATGSGA